jgi:hypothetical protein
MASQQTFSEQLSRCVQSEAEILSFVEAFAKVRLKDIIGKLTQPPPTAVIEADERTTAPDWADVAKLRISGIEPAAVADRAKPEQNYLHIDTAVNASQKAVEIYLAMTGLSDKQRSEIFPTLSRRDRRRRQAELLIAEVQRLNAWLDWVRRQHIDPLVFTAYHRHLSIHGAGQNVGGHIGSVGATIAFTEALNEIDPRAIRDRVGDIPPLMVRSPEEIYDYLNAGRTSLRALLLTNGRAVLFASDPDVAIVQPLGPPFRSAEEALKTYEPIRRQPELRRQRLHEFVLGEVKTATDRANLHERLALGSRETRDEVRTDRFLMMAILTADLVRGGSGRKSGRTLQNRDVDRFSDVFNLHHAWGWDGGREGHPAHWKSFKTRLAYWCGLPEPRRN